MVVVESLLKGRSNDEVAKCNYYYRMVRNEIKLVNEEESMEVQAYGIEIERQDTVNNMVVNVERDCIKNISPHRHKVHNLLKMLYDNTVSPYHLVDVLGDYVDEYSLDFDEALKKTEVN